MSLNQKGERPWMALEEDKAVQMVAAERKDSQCPGTEAGDGWQADGLCAK